MTLIVGIKCADDAIVLGSESAATYGALGQQTISQHCDKIEIVRDEVLLGVSGPVGLGQRFHGELAKKWASGTLRSQTSWEIATTMRKAFHPHIEDEMKAAAMALPVIGGAAQSSALSATLIAMPVYKDKNAALFQFDQQGAPEEATIKLPWVCIGSGQLLADPFMAFLRDVFWPTGYPSLPDAVFSAVWTITQCISVAPGGIGGAVHICTTEKSGEKWIAREWSEDELSEHKQAIDNAREALADFRAKMQTPEEETPPPPVPQPAESSESATA